MKRPTLAQDRDLPRQIAEAIRDAIIAGDLRVQAKAAERTMMVHSGRNDAPECKRWYGISVAAQARGNATPEAQVALALNAYRCPKLAGDMDAARKILEDAVPLAEQMGDTGNGLLGDLWFNIASLEWTRNNRSVTLELVEAAEAAWGDRFPEGHRRSLAVRSWRIVVAEADGDVQTLVRELKELAEVKAHSRGVYHGDATFDTIALAITQCYLGDIDAARETVGEVERRHALRPDLVRTADTALLHVGRGAIAELEGDLDTASVETANALAMLPDDDTWLRPQVALSRLAILTQLGRSEDARPLYAEVFGKPGSARAWEASCWRVLGGEAEPDVVALMRNRPEGESFGPYSVALCAAAHLLTEPSDAASRRTVVARLTELRPGLTGQLEYVARRLDVKISPVTAR